MSSQFYRSSTLPDINSHRPLSAANHVTFSNDFDHYGRRSMQPGPYDAYPSREAYVDKDQWADRNRIESMRRSHIDYPKAFDSSLNPTLITDHSSQVKELICRLEERDSEVWGMRGEMETMRKREVQLQASIQRLQRQLVMLESEQVPYRKEEYLNEAYKNVQGDNRELQNRVLELEERLKIHLEERERSEQEKVGTERRLREVTRTLSSLLYLEGWSAGMVGTGGVTDLSNQDRAIDDITKKVEEVMQDNAMLKGVQVNLKDQVARLEGQDIENKETILRISGEIEKQQQFVSKCSIEVEAIKVERDRALTVKEEQDREMVTLRERLETLHKSWEQMKGEVEERRGCRRLVEAERIRDGVIGDNSAYRLKSFKESLSKLLGADEMFERLEILSHEQDIVTALNSLIVQKHEYKTAMENNWKLLEDLTFLTDDLCDKLKREPYQNRDVLIDIQSSLERIKNAKNGKNFTFAGFETKDKKLRLVLERIGGSLMIPTWRCGVGVEEMVDEMVMCVERLVEKVEKGGGDKDDKDRHIINLQRKVISLKEQAGQKDRQIDMLKESFSDNDQERSRDEGTERIVEKYRLELNEAHLEIRQLRQKLYEIASLKSEMKEGKEILRNIEGEIEGHMREKREKQATIQQLELRNQQMRKHLHNSKVAIDRITLQYKQLHDLKSVLAGMLGIPAATTIAVDFEVLSRVEQLILACSNQTTNSLFIDRGRSVNMAQRYKRSQLNHPPNNNTLPGHNSGDLVVDGYNGNGRVPTNRNKRSRSFSPIKKFDTRVF